MSGTPNQSENINALNAMLMQELAACNTYSIVLDRTQDKAKKDQLSFCAMSHLARANALRTYITDLNGKSANGPGFWGSLANMVESGLASLGDKAAINMLQAVEHQDMKTYENNIDALDPDSRLFVKRELIPRQEEVGLLVSSIVHEDDADVTVKESLPIDLDSHRPH